MSALMKQYWALLARYLKPQWHRVATLAVLIAGGISLQLISPQIMRVFIDTVVAGARDTRPEVSRQLSLAALTYLGIAVLNQALSMATTYLSETVAWTATNALRRDLTLHSLRLDMSFHKVHTPGELIERIDGDVTTLASFFSQMVIRLVSNSLLAVGILTALFYEDWRAGLIGAVYVSLIATAVRAVRQTGVAAWGDSRQASAELFGFLGERLAATEDIRANGGEAHVMARLSRLMRTLFLAWRKARLVHALSSAVGSIAHLLTRVGALATGAALFLSGQMTIGTVYLLVRYFGRLRAPLDGIRHHMDDLQQASASIERVAALFRERSRLRETSGLALPTGALRVAFHDVTFRYQDGLGGNGRESVLHGISFVLEPGKTLGLLGRTGSGKTSLTRLLFRLYDPAAGAIRLGDIDLRDIRLSDLRQHVGLVTQDVQLFRGSVRDNVSLFRRDLSDAPILSALRELGLWHWYRSLPNGLDTELLTGGQSLSAGEAQLLAFTRVYLKDPGLVILDEASSRLDPATERLLERAIDRLLRDRTAIVIAHRLRTVGRADEIIVLEGGRIREFGGREALASDPSTRFHSLLQTGLGEMLA